MAAYSDCAAVESQTQKAIRPCGILCHNEVQEHTNTLPTKVGCVDPNIKPRTAEEKAKRFASISTSQKGESLHWYDFGKWTHPFYHKSGEQSSLENGILTMVPSWNKYVQPPLTTVGPSRPLQPKREVYLPVGPDYQRLWDHNRSQPRPSYSRYTMPDLTTHSLHSLQNPQERHKAIPCMRDQQILVHDIKNNLCQDPAFKTQKEAYEKEAMKHQVHLRKLAPMPPIPDYSNVNCNLGASYNHSAFQPQDWINQPHAGCIPNTNVHPEQISQQSDYCLGYDKFTTGNADIYEPECFSRSYYPSPKPCTKKHNNALTPNNTCPSPSLSEMQALNYIEIPKSSWNNKSVTWADEIKENSIKETKTTSSFCDNPSRYMNMNSSNNNINQDSMNLDTNDNPAINNTNNNNSPIDYNYAPFNHYNVSTGRKPCDVDGCGPRHHGCNKMQSIKRGKDLHYMDVNSEFYRSDIPVDYSKKEDAISFKITDLDRSKNLDIVESSHDRCSVPQLPPIDETLAQKSVRLSEASKPPRFVLACEKQPEPDYYENCRQKAELYLMAEPNIYSQQLETKQNPRLREKEDVEGERLAKMKVLLMTGELNYPYMERGVIGYTGHQPRQALQMPVIKDEKDNEKKYKTTYRTTFSRYPYPSYEYIKSRSRLGHRAPFSEQITLNEPYNPYWTHKSQKIGDDTDLQYQSGTAGIQKSQIW